MERYDRSPPAGTGGPANTPAFGSPTPGGRTPVDHQIPDETGPSHGAAGGGAGGSSAGSGGGGRAEALAGKAEERINQGMKSAADRLQDAARRIDEVADEKLAGATGTRARAGEAAHAVSGTMESVAAYLRDNDAEQLRSELERQMRERPLQTLMVAVAAGWVVGKILR